MKLLAAALVLAALAAGQMDNRPDARATSSSVAPDDAQAVADYKARLSDDSAVAALAQRLAQSSLGAQISDNPDQAGRLADIAAWIRANPDQAAGLGVGLARDDASGTHQFENAMDGAIQQGRFVFNPASKNGLYGRLRKTSLDSRLMTRDAGMKDEERAEILSRIFEGKNGASNRIITRNEQPPPPGASSSGPGVLDSGYYDRLGRGNLRGYSPQLQALQSALNRRRPPGAPPLIETGRLDYATLSYPGWGLRYDIANLEQRLRLERNYALARALGQAQGLTRDKLLDDAFEAGLLAQAKARGIALSARAAAGLADLEQAAAATRAFDSAARAAKSPSRISRRLLKTLGQRQKEAARWITAASLEEELERLDPMEGFLSPELLAVIDRCPAAPHDRDEYRRRGQDYEAGLERLRQDDKAALAGLESDGWAAQVAPIQSGLDADAQLRQALGRDIDDYVKAAYLFAESASNDPRWRQILDDWIRTYLPSSSYGRELVAAKRRRASLKDVFVRIAMGDADAAHRILAADDPSGVRR